MHPSEAADRLAERDRLRAELTATNAAAARHQARLSDGLAPDNAAGTRQRLARLRDRQRQLRNRIDQLSKPFKAVRHPEPQTRHVPVAPLTGAGR